MKALPVLVQIVSNRLAGCDVVVLVDDRPADTCTSTNPDIVMDHRFGNSSSLVDEDVSSQNGVFHVATRQDTAEL